MFPALALKYKVVAPGSKTFAQVMYARFGKLPHILLCIASISFNVFLVSSLMSGTNHLTVPLSLLQTPPVKPSNLRGHLLALKSSVYTSENFT